MQGIFKLDRYIRKSPFFPMQYFGTLLPSVSPANERRVSTLPTVKTKIEPTYKLQLEPAVTSWYQTLLSHDKKKHKNPVRAKVFRQWLSIYGNEIKGLRLTYTRSRDQIDYSLLQHARSAFAYMLGFHLPNFARVYRLLERVNRTHNLHAYLEKQACHLYDIGCGTGAFAHAFLTAFPLKKPQVSLLDPNRHLLKLATDMVKSTGADCKPIQCKAHELRMPQGLAETSIFLLGNVLNQIQKPEKRYEAFIDRLLQQVNRNSLLFILEPATEDSAVDMMRLRNELVAGGFVSLYPCPHAMPCPLLGTRDRCYSDFPLLQIPEMKWLDEQTGVKRHVFSAAAYCFASPSVAQALQVAPPLPVLIGKPLVQETKVGMLCMPTGTVERKALGGSKKMRGEKTTLLLSESPTGSPR